MRRSLAVVVVGLVAVFVSPLWVQAQRPSLAEVLKKAAEYVADFQKQLSGLVADETYLQEVLKHRNDSWFYGGSLNSQVGSRRLKSDLLLVKPAGADRYVEFRDVFEVDGAPIRNREDRLSLLVLESSPRSVDRVYEIINQSARFNIGTIERNVNTPLLALQFLDAAFQSRFEFKRASRERTATTPSPAAATDPGVFRVSTELWAVEYREKKRPTIIRTPRGEAQPAKGRFWLNPTTGAILMSELEINGKGVTATITVSYQSEPLLGFFVPVAMHESYTGLGGEHVIGTATYGAFRQLTK